MEPFRISFATTREDYLNSRFAQARVQIPFAYDFAAKLLGVYLLLLACIFLAVCSVLNMPFQWLGAVLAAGGVFLLFLWRPLLDSLIRRHAEADFESGRGSTPSQNVWFYPDCVRFISERYEAEIPYEMFCRAYEDESVLLLYTGLDECRCIPKRALGGEECRLVESLLSERMKQKFKQEGARKWMK